MNWSSAQNVSNPHCDKNLRVNLCGIQIKLFTRLSCMFLPNKPLCHDYMFLIYMFPLRDVRDSTLLSFCISFLSCYKDYSSPFFPISFIILHTGKLFCSKFLILEGRKPWFSLKPIFFLPFTAVAVLEPHWWKHREGREKERKRRKGREKIKKSNLERRIQGLKNRQRKKEVRQKDRALD